MRRKVALSALAAAVVLAAGCTSVSTDRQFNELALAGMPQKPLAHIHADNFGYYLFNCIPVFVGDTEYVGGCALFEDTVQLDPVLRLVTREARAWNTDRLTNLQTRLSSTCFFSSIPYIGTTLGLVWYREIQISAVAVKDQTPQPTPER